MQVLVNKILWKILITGKTQTDITAGMRNGSRPENIVPKRQGDPEVDPVGLVLGHVIGMVPNVHFGAVEYLFHYGPQQERSQGCSACYYRELKAQTWIV